MVQVYAGDHSSLVDQLISDSEIKPPAGSTYTGFGRDLVPFFDMHEATLATANPCMAALETTATKRGAQRGSPRKVAAGAKSKTADPVNTNTRGGSPPARNGTNTERRTQPTSPGRLSPRKAGKLSVQASPATYFTPGFSQSPKPEMVPLPTFGLLQRAVARNITACKVSTMAGAHRMFTPLQVAA
jgi:hypothetical protein